MEIKRTTEIFVETSRQFIVRLPESGAGEFSCPQCGAPLVAAEHAAVVFAISYRTVYKTLEVGATHFVETSAGAAMLCLPSFAAALSNDLARRLPIAAIGGLEDEEEQK